MESLQIVLRGIFYFMLKLKHIIRLNMYKKISEHLDDMKH